MQNFIRSRGGAWCGMGLIVLVLIFTFSLRTAWWSFIDIFFLFMAAFAHLAASYLAKLNPYASKTLDSCAFWMLVLGIIAFIAEFIAWQIVV